MKKGTHHSEKSIQKLRFSILHSMSDQRRLNMSLAHMGQVAWNKGKPFSEETRKKMSESAKGKFFLKKREKN